MAPKKRSAYYYFMLDYLKKEECRGKRFPNGLSDIAPIAASAWEVSIHIDVYIHC